MTPKRTTDRSPDLTAVEPPRQPWRLVAVREMVTRVTDRNFVVMTIITVALMAGVLALNLALGNRETRSTIAVVDDASARIVATTQERLSAAQDRQTITSVRYADSAAASAAVQDEAADAFLRHTDSGWTLTTLRSVDSSLSRDIGQTVQQSVIAENAAAAGTSVAQLTRGATLTSDTLVANNGDETMQKIMSYVFALLFYMAALMFGMQIATSVVEEKQSRIVEILTTAIPLRQLLTGKVLGNAALAFGQMAIYVGVGLIGLAVTGQGSMLPAIAGSAGWFLAFFIAGFLALACAWAVAGALASRNEDLQSTTMPLTIVLVGAFMIAFVVQGAARVICSYVPIVSAIVMPSRVVGGEAMWWEPVVSLVVTLIFAAVVIVLGSRVYQRSVMQSGGRLTLREAWRARA